MPRILISGYYGFGNTGDEAVLHTMVQRFRVLRPQLDLTVLSADPPKTEAQHGVAAVARTDLMAIWRALRRSHLLISGGGSLLQDVTGPFTVPYYLTIMWLARAAGVPVMVFAQGVGPLRTRWSRQLVRATLDRIQAVTVRDTGSRELLRELGVTRVEVQVTADPVLASRREDAPDADDGLAARLQQELPPGCVPVGLNLRQLGLTAHEREQLLQAVLQFAARTDAGMVLLPMHHPEDSEILAEVQEALQGAGHACSWVPPGRAPGQVMRLMETLSFVIGMRLHSLIFSAVAGTPMAGISYDPKVDRFLSQLGQDPSGTVGHIQAEALSAKLVAALAQRHETAAAAARHMALLQRRADRNWQEALQLLPVGTLP